MAKRTGEKLNKGKLNLSRFIVFLMGFSQATLIYVMSSYFVMATGMQNVGIFYAVSYAIFLIILLNMYKLVGWIGKSNIFYFSLFFKIIVTATLVYINPSGIGALLLIFYIILGHIEWVAMDLIVESFSTDKMSGRIRGIHLTILNAGFLFGPFISTYVLNKSNFYGIFILVLILNTVILSFALVGLRNVNHNAKKKLNIMGVLRKVWKRKNIMRIYYVSFVLEFFYALMVIYTPIYLRNLGYSWESIGLMFTCMLLPFVLLQYPIGFLADKKMGEKELLVVALLIMSFSTFAIYFIGSATIVWWAIVLFATRVGASLIEILRDSYFFKRVGAEDVDIIDFFRTALPVGYIVATLVAFFVLLFTSINFVFILIGAVAISAIYPALRLVDNKCEKEVLIRKRRKLA